MKHHQAELALEEVERRRRHVPQRDGRQANQPCVQLGEQVHKDFFVKKLYCTYCQCWGSVTFSCGSGSEDPFL
jgi:hypothetical protein